MGTSSQLYNLCIYHILYTHRDVCVCEYKIMCNNILVYTSVFATCCAILVNHKNREFDLNFHREYIPLSLFIII